MVWVSVESAAYLPEILNNSPPAHPDTHDLRYLESFSRSYGLGEIGIRPFQKFVVFSAQSLFPTEACRLRYLLIPIQKENVNQMRE